MLTLCLIFILLTETSGQVCFSDSSVTSRLKHDIYVLASDSMQGRQAGTVGEQKACDYIVGRFREAGIKPWLATGYTQSFSRTLSQFRRTPGFYIGGEVLIWGSDFGVCSYSSSDSVSAYWADCGSGISIPGSPFDCYQGMPDIRGKIFLISLENPSRLAADSSKVNELSVAFRIANAVKKGAAGILLWNDDGSYRSRLFDLTKTDTLTVPVFYVTRQTASLIRSHPSAVISMSSNLRRTIARYSNVAAYIDRKASRTIILGAHYDHLGISQNPKDKGLYYVGADDNASGTAGVLEMARYYSVSGDSSNNYLIVLFSAEEEGLLGSAHFVKTMSRGFKDSVNFMMNLDMIGRLGCEGLQVTAEATGSSASWRPLYNSIKHPGFSLKKVHSSLPFSDQDAFYKAGIPVLYLTTGLHSRYHTPDDLPETINYTGMTSIVGYAERLVSAAGTGKKVSYRKVPGICTSLETAGFVLDFIGNKLSW